MVDATRNHVLKCEIEDRMENHLSSKIDERFMEMAASMQQTLHDSLTQSLALSMLQQMQDLLHNNNNDANHSPTEGNPIRGEMSSYSCGTRLARIDFPRFSGDDVKQWLIQCDTLFSIDNTLEEFKVRLTVVHFEGKAFQ